MLKKTQQELAIPWSESPELQQMLSRVVPDLLQIVENSACYVYGVGKELETFIPVFADGSVASERELFFSMPLTSQTESLLHRMLARPMTFSLSRELDLRHMSGSVLEKLQAQFAIVVPLLTGETLIGLLMVIRHDTSMEFTPIEIRQIEWLATAITPAIENTHRYHQALERLAEAEALHQITLSIMQKSGVDEALKTICDEAKQITSSCGASIALLENTTWMRIMYCVGETSDTLGRVRVTRSHMGRALHTRTEPLIINTSSERPNAIPRLVIPLSIKGHAIGLLTLFRQTDFTPEDMRLMSSFATQASIAIDQAQLVSFSQEMAILEERHRLSRELHDSVNQLLYGISLYTEAATRQLDQGKLDAVRRYLKNIEESDRSALQEMRMLIFGLRPSGLAQMGLQTVLNQRFKSVEEKLGVEYSLKWRIVSTLEPQTEEALYGIVQEALNNSIRHARAHRVSVRFAEDEHQLTMTVRDDGIGFDPNHISSGGMGLKTMRERAASLNARIRIDSQPGRGTRVIVEVAL